MKSALTDAAGVEVYPVPDVYPMGWERVLVREVLHKEYRITVEVSTERNACAVALQL